MSDWRPIETAPKDGSDTLLYWPLAGASADRPRIRIGYWRDPHGWVWQDRAVRSYSSFPTHWMPLPEPPQ